MTVTNIIEYNKTKVLVHLDEHLVFPIYKKELNRFQIKIGFDLSESAYHELFLDILPKRVKRRAMYLLTKQDYSTEKLRQKLLCDHYPEELAEQAIEYVRSYGYIDDERYAYAYIMSNYEHKSRRKIGYELATKGIRDDIIQSAWNRFSVSESVLDEEGQIKKILDSKHFDPKESDYKEIVKMMNYLYRKGYNQESIRKVMRMPDIYE